MRNLLKRLVKIFMYAVLFLWMVSVSALDSPSWVPFIITVICTVILGLYAWANNWFWDYDYREDDDQW